MVMVIFMMIFFGVGRKFLKVYNVEVGKFLMYRWEFVVFCIIVK